MFTFLAGLRRTGPSTAAILSTFEPVVTTVLAALILSESLTPLQYAGGLLVLSSVVVLQLRSASAAGLRRRPAEPPTADLPPIPDPITTKTVRRA